MPYHGLRKWSAREMEEIANELSSRPEFKEGEIVNTKRDNGCLCQAEIISCWLTSDKTYSYWVEIRNDGRRIRKENEMWL